MSSDGSISGAVAEPVVQANGLPSPLTTEPEVFAPLVAHVHRHRAQQDRPIVEVDDARDRLVVQLRHRLDQQLSHDLDYTYAHLWVRGQEVFGGRQMLEDSVVEQSFQWLSKHREFLRSTDGWSSNRAELECWNRMQQFYCDALALAHYLLAIEEGRAPWRRQPPRIRLAPGTHAYGLRQALVNGMEQAIPDIVRLSPLSAALPIAIYQSAATAAPWMRFKWERFLRYFHRMYTGGFLAGYNPGDGQVLEVVGKQALIENDEFFDRRGRTRHNMILAISHRHSVMDCPFLAEALRGIDTAAWANALYFPRSAERDPQTILVSPTKKKPMRHTLARSAQVLIEKRLPLVIFVDGGGPYLLYGQQMRVKRGIRLLVDHLSQNRPCQRRRSYIVPISFNDTITFIQGLRSKVTITFHEPIDLANIAPAHRPADPALLNYGDPLLCHLEAHFLTHTGQIEHGYVTPQVLDTVRSVSAEAARATTWRQRACRGLHASIFDLCRRSRTAC